MKKLFGILSIAALLITSSCGTGPSGDLIGVQNRPEWYDVDPYGTVYIPMGSFIMGSNGQDVPWAVTSRPRTVSLGAYYMDETEITNNEYRQFVYWVRDSIARGLIIQEDEDYAVEVGLAFATDQDGYELDEKRQNQDAPVPWEEIRWNENNDDEVAEKLRTALGQMYYSDGESFKGKKEIDTRKLIYQYEWIDYKLAASKGRYRHSENGDNWEDRSTFIKKDLVHVYPDTLAWIADFSYSYNEPAAKMYFWHPAYDDYPVVGVTWQQANAFAIWRTDLLNRHLDMSAIPNVQDFRLPTESEWEYASRGGLDQGFFPWGGYYLRNDLGCFMANFKPLRGNYIDDGGFNTVNVYSYTPNDYGLYNMSGNVAEWTSSAYDPSSYEFGHDMNHNYQYNASEDDAPALKRKVIRGGSWKDIGYYLQNGSRTWEYQDTAKTYIGFRNVMSYLGRSKGDAL